MSLKLSDKTLMVFCKISFIEVTFIQKTTQTNRLKSSSRVSFEFFHLEVNSDLSNESKAKMMNSVTLHYLPVVISQIYSQQKLKVASFCTTGIINS